MRTTVNLPDDLFRRAKAAAALRGCKFNDLIEEGLLRVLDSNDGGKRKPVSLYELMKDSCGVFASEVTDLATDPKQMEGFGSNVLEAKN